MISLIQEGARHSRDEIAEGIPGDLERLQSQSAIQPHGVLVAVRCSDLQVMYASANSPEIFGGDAAALFSKKLPELVGEAAMATIRGTWIEEQYSPAVVTLTGVPELEHRFEVVTHKTKDFYCVEFQPEAPREGEILSARVQRTIQELRSQKVQRELWMTAVAHLRALTGYDRVMIYRFDEDGNGQVLAEDKEAGMKPYLGLHYPVAATPRQPAKLALAKRLKTIADVWSEPVIILAHPELACDEPLDTTHCILRSVPLSQLEYLRKLGTGATMTLPLIHNNEPWGVVVCHHRTAKYLSAEMRLLCELLGQLLSVLIEVTSQAEEFAARKQKQEILDVLNFAMVESEEDVGASLAENGQQLCSLVGADGACIQVGGLLRLVGETPAAAEVKAIFCALRQRLQGGLEWSSEIAKFLPEVGYLAPQVSGILIVPVMRRPSDAVLWFRRETVKTIQWGGSLEPPRVTAEGDGLPCCKTEEGWSEVQHGRSLPWLPSELHAAASFGRLVTDALLRQAEATLTLLSHHDPLTDLPNRRVLLSRLADWAGGAPTTNAVLLFMDIDHFKTVNDSFGHAIGDELLRQVASRLNRCAGEQHLVARLGGDEFVIFCMGISVVEAEEIAKNILKAFAEPFMLAEKPFRTSASIGIAGVSGCSAGRETDSLQAADSAMYVAKQHGGNQYSVYETPLHEKVLRQLLLEQSLFQALENEEMFLEYQPKVGLEALELLGFEALLRWRHPVYGLVSPAEFIPLAEKTGQIVPIGTWVLRESLRQIREWRERFDVELTMAVNVSAQQVSCEDFKVIVEAALSDMGVSCDSLQIEVTESILMHDLAVSHLEDVRASGVTVAVDDFGTGYSSLSYLQRLPIDVIKIDRTFMEQVGEDERKTALFGAVIHMAHTLGLKVVGEGVESGCQLNCVRKMLCDDVQGYFISRPLSPRGIEDEMESAVQRKPFQPLLAAHSI